MPFAKQLLQMVPLKIKQDSNCTSNVSSKQNAGVLGWPLKLLQSPYSKVRLTSSLPLRPNRRIFLAFNAPSQFFLRESHKAVVWWEHCVTQDFFTSSFSFPPTLKTGIDIYNSPSSKLISINTHCVVPPYPPPTRLLEIPRQGGGGSEAKFF